ncbi:MAG: hypothetical protein VKL60_18035 [Sphaerospermopsis sp.]|nr:hypothetical protein [Sphaerospermopsis sp.]
MLTIVAKRVQSRLSRKGVKVELKDIRTHLENTVSNVNKITKQETNQAEVLNVKKSVIKIAQNILKFEQAISKY